MLAMEQLEPSLAEEMPRPSTRSFTFGGASASRTSVVKAIAEGLLEIRTWPSAGELGDASHLVLETELDGEEHYVQFLSEPGARGVLCEIASGFYAKASEPSAFRSTPAQSAEMESRGFSDGLESNHRKKLVFDAPDAATTIASEVLALLGDVFGWSASSTIHATLRHNRRSPTAIVFDGLSRGDVLELLVRHGLEARSVQERDASSESATLEAALEGCVYQIHMANRVEGTPRYRLLAARAQVGRDIDPAAANPFNALTGLGRSWVDDGTAYLEASLRVVGVTEEAFHSWLEGWETALTTARSWYRRIELRAETELALGSHHFDARVHDVHRMARCHVKPAAEERAMDAFADHARAPEQESADAIDAWRFFEGWAAAHPTEAMPIEERFVSAASATDLGPWLERLDGVRATVTASGEMEIRHAVPGGTLVLSPPLVRRVAFSSERFAVSVVLAGDGGPAEVFIGTSDFYFSPGDPRVELDGVQFHVADMPASMSWFETKQRLRTLERHIAWAGPLACGAALAGMSAALEGAERVGLACSAERERFDAILAAARRSFKSSRAPDSHLGSAPLA